MRIRMYMFIFSKNAKTSSVVFDPAYLIKTIECALDREQIQPILL